jgi:hypothetical protein
VLLRLVPLWLYASGGCVRDECTYRGLARGIVAGGGLEPAEGGWLWAPGYPYVLAACLKITGNEHDVRWLQLAAAIGTVAVLYGIGARIGGKNAARGAALAYALHPTFAFFTGTLWSEVLYTFFLMAAVLALLWARDGKGPRGAVAGALVGACVLFRGVATYMAPIFALAALWPAEGEDLRTALRTRWPHAAACLAGLALTVAPYSIEASAKHGGLVISDATLGQMMWLGDNDFPPITFDYANGLYNTPPYEATTGWGREHCPKTLPAAKWNACETHNGVTWIEEHPREFATRIPLRLAQLFDPNTFLTRHLRWSKWGAFPWELKELVVAWVAATSALVVLGGSAAGFLRGKGPFAVLAGGIVAYHVAAIAMLAGLSRYRLPLEPFGMLFLAVALGDPRGTWAVARSSPIRTGLAALAVVWLLPLVLWFAPTGWPWWH